jgi:hypothetical protein
VGFFRIYKRFGITEVSRNMRLKLERAFIDRGVQRSSLQMCSGRAGAALPVAAPVRTSLEQLRMFAARRLLHFASLSWMKCAVSDTGLLQSAFMPEHSASGTVGPSCAQSSRPP